MMPGSWDPVYSCSSCCSFQGPQLLDLLHVSVKQHAHSHLLLFMCS